MPTHNLAKIFQPKSIAIIGASEKPGSVGRTVLENLQRAKFPGELYPINPKYESLQKLRAYPSVEALPRVPDLAIIATPAATVPALIKECGDVGVRGLIILTAGFREVGAAGEELEGGAARCSLVYSRRAAARIRRQAQARQEGRRRQVLDPRRRQLNRQRNPFEAAA